jgi:peptidase C39-like protein
MLPTSLQLPVRILPQPTETTCGPTCLHALYHYWGGEALLSEVIGRTRALERGGTFAVFLACDALSHGYDATIYTYNLMVFDPVWFARGVDVAARLEAQRLVKGDPRLLHATEGYLEFLRLGGRLRFTDLSPVLVRGLLRRGLPILTGLSSTFLYRSPREYGIEDIPDDIRGTPSGHFVVIAGFDRKARKVLVADPYAPHPYGGTHEYWIRMDRVLNAVLLGIVTHDANLLVIAPRRGASDDEQPDRRR